MVSNQSQTTWAKLLGCFDCADVCSALSAISVTLEVEPQLKDVVLELAAEAMAMWVLPLTADDFECNILQESMHKYCARPWQNEDTLWWQHCVLRCCPSVAKRGNIVARRDFRNIFWVQDTKFVSDTNVAHMTKRGNIWETWSCQQCCRHNVSSFCQPLSPTHSSGENIHEWDQQK